MVRAFISRPVMMTPRTSAIFCASRGSVRGHGFRSICFRQDRVRPDELRQCSPSLQPTRAATHSAPRLILGLACPGVALASRGI